VGTAERKEREKQRRRNDILDAAEEVFFEKGFRNATMDDVAEKAEVAKGTLYLHFKSREMLQIAINVRAMTVLKERFYAAVAGKPNGAEKLMAIGWAYIRFAEEFPYYFRAMSFFETLGPEDLEKIKDEPGAMASHESGSAILGLMAETVREGQADGSLREDLDPMKTAILLWAGGNGAIQMHRNKGDHMVECHGLPAGFVLDEFMLFCSRSLLKDPSQYKPEE